MNSRDQKLKYTKHRIYRLLIIPAVCILLLFTGYSLYAHDECDYKYGISVEGCKNPGEIMYYFDFECEWIKGKKWRIIPSIILWDKKYKVETPLIFNLDITEKESSDSMWGIRIKYDEDNRLRAFGYGKKYPMCMRIIDNTGLNLDYLNCKLALTYENLNGEISDNIIVERFDEKYFKGFLKDGTGVEYNLLNFQWIMEKNKLGTFLLQAEITGEDSPVAQPTEEEFKSVEKKEKYTLSTPLVQPTPSETKPTFPMSKELLIVVSDGITMRKRNWFGISQLTVLDLVTESNAKLMDKKVAIARGCNANLDVLMHPAETGSHSKEIQEALKKATYPVVKSENQRLYEMLESIPALIKREKFVCPDVIVIISVDWSFCKDINEDTLLNALFKDCAIDNNLGIIYLELNAEDRFEEMDQFITRIDDHKIFGARIKRENLIIGKAESDVVIKEKIAGCIEKLLSDFKGGNSP